MPLTTRPTVLTRHDISKISTRAATARSTPYLPAREAKVHRVQHAHLSLLSARSVAVVFCRPMSRCLFHTPREPVGGRPPSRPQSAGSRSGRCAQAFHTMHTSRSGQ
eukprot:4634198-Prymnesium_polylepis.1